MPHMKNERSVKPVRKRLRNAASKGRCNFRHHQPPSGHHQSSNGHANGKPKVGLRLPTDRIEAQRQALDDYINGRPNNSAGQVGETRQQAYDDLYHDLQIRPKTPPIIKIAPTLPALPKRLWW